MSDFDPMAIGGRTDENRETRARVRAGGPAVARDQLRSIVERIERLEEEKKTIGDDIKDVYAEAKATGFDTKALRRIIARRKKDQQEVMEEDAVFETYLVALGMQLPLPLDREGDQ
ncbi:DUF2312 domain-containing protein [uncultured Martelella sp.]|uniref:DUF2312 domain-containing protein n=1 Tax=uncultured Martelella sp. TaxID=392331 RepID=UPI0029C81C24|nr:DUF2312 domain-containing protein [uncultured Martelella sp.]